MTAIDYLRMMMNGFLVTLQLTALALPLSILFAFAAGLGRLSRSRLVRATAICWIEFFRGTSVVVQLFWAYFVLPLFGLPLTPMQAGVLVLAMNVGAYAAEIVRAAILAVPREQIEAAVALNLNRWQRLRHVILPQALVIMMPSLGNSAIELLKGTSIVSLISLADLTFNAEMIRAQTGDVLLPFMSILVLYYLGSLALTAAARGLERHLARGLDVTHTATA
jgi:polar amino acid transport system permease protein